MKIAFLTPEYPHVLTGNSGGIGTSIKNLAAGLVAAGCEVRVLVYGQAQDAVFMDEMVVIQRIKNIKIKGLSWFFTRKKLERIINELHESNQIDLVEAPDWTGITSFISPKKCPIVIRLNGSDTYFCNLDNRSVKWKNKFHEKRAVQKADAVLSVSQFTADQTNAVFGLNKKITIIPNSIDINSFNQNKDSVVVPNTVLYFGSLIRKKGLLELPLIFNKLIEINPAVELIIVGKDVSDIISGAASTWEMMQERFTPEALLRVNYVGAVPYAAIQPHINAATVCVFPSFAEALPVSWIEAIALRKPIVASNIGWATDVIDDGINGFLVHPKEHSLYASKINSILENAALQHRLGLAAREKAIAKFSVAVVAKQSMDFYKNVIFDND
ncbi:glycosyltransferase family 4 protein [Flavobacterium sp. F-380]|uniref:Glycosyltransferase family 4 protein n=1 Tax=Flavobacterium kayseriense TaxID=2764714 RepID=A0ABR7J7N6_9FLAO|nr:glycosyltransferase family 4 protein [Flavobacterium kayseriense]MBC5841418.1 glycosyltransferase family 4 protein [Flavobacterium kayseriense]MBC5847946.1 glycosyltransferase family 4 protein [Flavobacterium kayseriense]